MEPNFKGFFFFWLNFVLADFINSVRGLSFFSKTQKCTFNVCSKCTLCINRFHFLFFSTKFELELVAKFKKATDNWVFQSQFSGQRQSHHSCINSPFHQILLGMLFQCNEHQHLYCPLPSCAYLNGLTWLLIHFAGRERDQTALSIVSFEQNAAHLII